MKFTIYKLRSTAEQVHALVFAFETSIFYMFCFFKLIHIRGAPMGENKRIIDPGAQSYDRESQRQRCKSLQRHEWPT
jgi:hypothetical protein